VFFKQLADLLLQIGRFLRQAVVFPRAEAVVGCEANLVEHILARRVLEMALVWAVFQLEPLVIAGFVFRRTDGRNARGYRGGAQARGEKLASIHGMSFCRG